MSFLKKKIVEAGQETLKNIGTIIDQISTTDEEKLRAKNELSHLVTERLKEMAGYQREVLLGELSGSLLQRNWRPIVMLLFSGVVVYGKFVAPAFGLPNTDLEPAFWDLLEIGLGGYVVGRSLEKISGKVIDNIDISFLRKKQRKTN